MGCMAAYVLFGGPPQHPCRKRQTFGGSGVIQGLLERLRLQFPVVGAVGNVHAREATKVYGETESAMPNNERHERNATIDGDSWLPWP